MDKFDIIDMSLIDRLGSENFNDIVMSLAKNNHKINYFYLFLNDHNPYNNSRLSGRGRIEGPTPRGRSRLRPGRS